MTVCCFAGFAQGQQPSATKLIESVVESRFAREGGKEADVWKKPWRIVILFNSSQAQNKSAYTNSVLESVKTFLTDRMGDGQPHKLWFFPYQIDLYTGDSQSIQDQPLTEATLTRLDRVFPRARFTKLGNNTTDYPQAGGHKNLSSRNQACELIKKSDMPTLLIQFTDILVADVPGQPKDPELGLDNNSGGVDAAGITSYLVPGAPITTEMAGQKYSVLIFGPSKLHDAPPQEVPGPGFPWKSVLRVVGGLAVVGLISYFVKFVATRRDLAKWSVSLPGNARAVLEKGETMNVYGPGAKIEAGKQSFILKGEGIPSEKLFEIHWTKSGARFKGYIWKVGTASEPSDPTLNTSGSITCTDTTTNRSQTVKVEVSAS